MENGICLENTCASSNLLPLYLTHLSQEKRKKKISNNNCQTAIHLSDDVTSQNFPTRESSVDSGLLSVGHSQTSAIEKNTERLWTTSNISSVVSDVWCTSYEEQNVDKYVTQDYSLQNIANSDTMFQFYSEDRSKSCPLPSTYNFSTVINYRSSALSPCLSQAHKCVSSGSLCCVHLNESCSTCHNLCEKETSLVNKNISYKDNCDRLCVPPEIDKFSTYLVNQAVHDALLASLSVGWSIKCSCQCQHKGCQEDFKIKENENSAAKQKNDKLEPSKLNLPSKSPALCWTPELPCSPNHQSVPLVSIGSVSQSHDSLITYQQKLDDSHFITSAISHDTLFPTFEKVSKRARNSVEADVYADPVDVVQPYQGKILQPKPVVVKKRNKRNNNNEYYPQVHFFKTENDNRNVTSAQKPVVLPFSVAKITDSKRLTVSSSDSETTSSGEVTVLNAENKNVKDLNEADEMITNKWHENILNGSPEQTRICRIIPFSYLKSCKKRTYVVDKYEENRRKGRGLSSNIRNTFATLFGLRKNKISSNKNEFIPCTSQAMSTCISEDLSSWSPPGPPPNHSTDYSAFTSRLIPESSQAVGCSSHLISCSTEPSGYDKNLCLESVNAVSEETHVPCSDVATMQLEHTSPSVVKRALPPLPSVPDMNSNLPKSDNIGQVEQKDDEGCDFASVIEKVKDYGWYWGPISAEAAGKVLANEPDGSFIVRDSSDHHYIFSLTFKLNGFVRHVRIEHDQGNFSFGGATKFKSQTIVEFIENAVEHSRSGRYLFFLHRRPVLGPMRVQLLHPVSRSKYIQSLQHLCRFVIVKHVRRDLISQLPLPQRIKDYLSSPHYYSEQTEHCITSATSTSSACSQPLSSSSSPLCCNSSEDCAAVQPDSIHVHQASQM